MPQIGPGQSNVSVDPNTGKSFGALPDLSISDDTSLQQIQDNYKQIGSSYNNMAVAAAANVGARQKSLIGNDFGATSPYMYDTYYEPGATSFASNMRMAGTQQALETGMDRGKKAAEKGLEDAKNAYSNAVDAYNNAVQQAEQLRRSYQNPTVAYFDGSQLGSDTETGELMSFEQLASGSLEDAKAAAMNGNTTYQLVTDWGEVGKDPRRTSATNATLSWQGISREEYDKWSKEKQDEFWNRSDVGNYWTKVYSDAYIKENYSQDIYAQYQDNYNKTVQSIEQVYNYAIGKIDNLVGIEADYTSMGYIELEIPTLSITEADIVSDPKFDTASGGYTYEINGSTEKVDLQDIINKVSDPDEKKFLIDTYANRVSATYLGQANNVSIQDYKKMDEIVLREFSGGHGTQATVQTQKVNVDDFMKKTLGVDMLSLQTLRRMKNDEPDKYNTLVYQAAAVLSGAETLDIADGKKWYLTYKGYEQLPEGTVVMFTPQGTLDSDGNVLDENLKTYMDCMKKLNDPAYNHTEEQREQLEKQKDEAWKKYYTTAMAAFQWESMSEATISEDMYRSILYRSNPSKYQDLTIQGKKISEIIAEWNKFAKDDPEKAYRAFANIVNDTWQQAGYYYAATPKFMGETTIEAKALTNEAGRDAIGKEGTERAIDWMPEESAAVLFQVLTTSIEQYRSGRKDGNIDPGIFMDKDSSGWLENMATKTAKGYETLFNTISNSLFTVGAAAANVVKWIPASISGDYSDISDLSDVKALSFQQIVDVVSGRFEEAGEDYTTFSKQFSGEYDENSWSYYYDVRNEQQENLADVFNPIMVGELTRAAEGVGRGQTARGVGFWENWTAIGNFTSGVVSMVAGNFVENLAEDAVIGAVKGISSKLSQNIMARLGTKSLSKLDDAFRPHMLNRAVDAATDVGQAITRADKAANFAMLSADDLTGALLKTSEAGGKLSLDYSDDLIRGLSYLADSPEELFTDVNDAFKKAFKSSIDNASGNTRNALKQTLKSAGRSVDDIATAFGGAIAGRTYRNMQITAFTGVAADVLENVPDSVQAFASRAIAANVARTPGEAIAMTSPSALAMQLKSATGRGYTDAVNFVASMDQGSLKKTIMDMFDTAASYAKNDLKWTDDDTMRFLARNGWGEMRSALIRNNWLKSQVMNHAENVLYQMSQPELTDDGSKNTTIEEYFTNPMNYITALTASGVMIGGQKILTRAQMAKTSKALNDAYNAYEKAIAENGKGAEKALGRVNKLLNKQAKLANKALDSSLSYAKIQEYTEDASEITERAWGELQKKQWLEVAREKGYTDATTAEEFINNLEENKIKSSDQLFLGSRIAIAETPNRYYNNKTALGARTNGLATIDDTDTLLRLNQIDMDFRKSHRFTEIKEGSGDIFSKNEQYYKELRAKQVAEFGHINGIDSALDHYYTRLVENMRDIVKRGARKEEDMRLGYEPIGALLDPDYDDNAATRGLVSQRANLDETTKNPALARAIDQESILKAIAEGKTESELYDIEGNIIMDDPKVAADGSIIEPAKPHIFQINAKGLNYLDRLSYYENSVQGHRILDNIFGRNDTELGKTLLKNNDVMLVAPKAAMSAAKADYGKLNEAINSYKKKIDNAIKASGKNSYFTKEVERYKTGITDEVEELIAKNDGRIAKISDLEKQKMALERQISIAKIQGQLTDPRSLASIGITDTKVQEDMFTKANELFSNLAQLAREGKLETIYRGDLSDTGDRLYGSSPVYIELPDGDGKYRQIELSESLYNHVNNYITNGGPIPQDATVYLAIARDLAVPYTIVDGVKTYEKRYKSSIPTTKVKQKAKATDIDEAWSQTAISGIENKKGKTLTQGGLSRISATTDDGQFNANGMNRINSYIEGQLRKSLPKGKNSERVIKAIQNYTTTIVKDIVNSTGDKMTFSDVIEIVDRIAPDKDLFIRAKDTGLLQSLNSLDKADISLKEISKHVDNLLAKALLAGDDNLDELRAASNLLQAIKGADTRAKTSSDFQVNLETDIGEEGFGYSGPISDISGAKASSNREAEEAVVDLVEPKTDVSDTADADAGTIAGTIKEQASTISSDMLTREEAEAGIDGLAKILNAMRNSRDPNYKLYKNPEITEKSKTSLGNRKKVNSFITEFNDIVKTFYNSKKYPELNKIVDNEVQNRIGRQSDKANTKNKVDGYDYAAAFGIARPETGYNRVDSQGQLIKATIAEGEDDSVFSPEYSKTRLEASTYGGHAQQVLYGYYKLQQLLNDVDVEKLAERNGDIRVMKFIDSLPKEQAPGASVLGAADNFENSLVFALGDVFDPKKATTASLFDYMFTPGYTQYGAPSAISGKVSLFTDEQMRATTYSKLSNYRPKATTITVNGEKYTIDSGFGFSATDSFEYTVYDSNGKEIDLDTPPEKVEPIIEEKIDEKTRKINKTTTNKEEVAKSEEAIARFNELKSAVSEVIKQRYSAEQDDADEFMFKEGFTRTKEEVREDLFEDSYEDISLFSGEDKLSLLYNRYLGSGASKDPMELKKIAEDNETKLKKLKDEMSTLNKEIDSTKKNIDKTTKTNISKDPYDTVAKKYLSSDDYKAYKELLAEHKKVSDFIENPTDIYRNSDGATFVGKSNGMKSYVSMDNLKSLFGWEPNKKQPTSAEIIADEKISKEDTKAAKKMRKQIGKYEGGKGITKTQNDAFEELWKELPKTMDSRSRGLTLNTLLELEKQVQEISGVASGSDIYITKDMAQLLTRIADTAYTPTGFTKFTSNIAGAAKWIQEQQMSGGVSFVNALSIVQIRDAIKTNPFKLVQYVKTCADMKNSKSVADWAMQNLPKLTEIALASHDTTLVTDLSAAISAKPGVEDGGVVQNLVSRVIGNKDTDWKGPKSVKDSVNGMVDDIFGDATFQNAIPVLRAKMAVLEYDKAVRQIKRKFPDIDPKLITRHAAELSYARTTVFFEPKRILTKGGLQGFLDNNYIRQKNILMNDIVGVKNGTTTKDIITGDPKTQTLMSRLTDVFFAMRYKMMLSGRFWSGFVGAGRDIASLRHLGAEEFTAENFNRFGTKFMTQGSANGIYSMMALVGIAAASCWALDIPTAWDDFDFVDGQGNPQVPALWQKFQTLGQIWLPNAYDPELGFYVDKSRGIQGIDTMASTFTLQNSLFKTADRIINPNNWSKQPQRGLPFLGVNNPINQFLNSTIPAAIGDELFASNLLSPYKAMYEIIMDTTYFGNNIWEKKYLPDGSENKNYDPMRNIVASTAHLLGLDEVLGSGKGYNDYVKGKYLKDGSLNPAYVDQDRIGTVSGSGILQHEFVSAAISFVNGEYLEGLTEAGELPIKTKNLSRQARTEFNNKVKNTIAQYMAEYKTRTENVSADEKDTIYAETVQKCADVVASWSSKWDYVFGDDQSLVPYATRVMIAMTAGEYDDNLAYLQNAIWKAENLTNLEHGSWSWLSDEDLDQWIAEGHTVEEFNAEKQRRTDAYNKALDDEYTARQALKAAGYSEELLEPYMMDDIKAASRAVNRKVFTSIQQKLESPIGEFSNFKEMKSYYEAQINAAGTTKQKAALADAYNKYVTDVLAPYVDAETGYGAAILTDGYYQGQNLAETLSDYIILPANKYYRGKSPRASYLKDLFGVGYRDKHNLPSDDEIIELFSGARAQAQKGATASALSMLDRAIEMVKKGGSYASDADYSKIVRLKALLGARS